MSKHRFSNELERALARPDIDRLRSILSAFHEWQAHDGVESNWDDGALDAWLTADRDTDLGLALVSLAAATYDEPDFLRGIAFGLLENLLNRTYRPAEDLMHRILEEARKTPRFRWMLSAVPTYSIDDNARKEIAEAVASMNPYHDPLPPRPWA